MGNKRKGFTLFEIMTAVVLMVIMTAIASMSLTSLSQTSKREAEKLSAYLTRLVQKSDRTKASFDMVMKSSEFVVSWLKHNRNVESFDFNKDCSYSYSNFETVGSEKRLIYDWKRYPRGVKIFTASSNAGYTSSKYITIKDAKSHAYYVIITAKDKQ